MCVCIYVCERLIERESEREGDGCWYDCGLRDEGIPCICIICLNIVQNMYLCVCVWERECACVRV